MSGGGAGGPEAAAAAAAGAGGARASGIGAGPSLVPPRSLRLGHACRGNRGSGMPPSHARLHAPRLAPCASTAPAIPPGSCAPSFEVRSLVSSSPLPPAATTGRAPRGWWPSTRAWGWWATSIIKCSTGCAPCCRCAVGMGNAVGWAAGLNGCMEGIPPTHGSAWRGPHAPLLPGVAAGGHAEAALHCCRQLGPLGVRFACHDAATMRLPAAGAVCCPAAHARPHKPPWSPPLLRPPQRVMPHAATSPAAVASKICIDQVGAWGVPGGCLGAMPLAGRCDRLLPRGGSRAAAAARQEDELIAHLPPCALCRAPPPPSSAHLAGSPRPAPAVHVCPHLHRGLLPRQGGRRGADQAS